MSAVCFRVYDIDDDGFISNAELFQILKMMTGATLSDPQLQQVVDKTLLDADKDGDGLISFEEFQNVRCEGVWGGGVVCVCGVRGVGEEH